jgi:hypothetical protein
MDVHQIYHSDWSGADQDEMVSFVGMCQLALILEKLLPLLSPDDNRSKSSRKALHEVVEDYQKFTDNTSSGSTSKQPGEGKLAQVKF